MKYGKYREGFESAIDDIWTIVNGILWDADSAYRRELVAKEPDEMTPEDIVELQSLMCKVTEELQDLADGLR